MPLVMVLLVAWLPLVGWLQESVLEGNGEPLVLLLIPWGLRCRPAHLDVRLAAALLGLRALAGPFLPELLQGALTALATVSFLSGWRDGKQWNFGLAGGLLLALPCIPALQFYLGYPLRQLVTRGAVALLNLSGQGVHAEGMTLVCGSERVNVDAPCSGVHMLWTALLCISLLAWLRRWTARTTLRWQVITAVATLAANSWRISALWFVTNERAEDEVGLVCFGLVLAGILSRCPGSRAREGQGEAQPSRGGPAFVVCALLGLLPSPADTTVPYLGTRVGWTEFEGRPLRELPLSAEDRRFFRHFPGSVARYSDGRRQLVVRRVTRVTRKLHPAWECYGAAGYKLSQPHVYDEWSGFTATGPEGRLWVREHIEGPEGVWTDTSQWFWSARWAPWWAVTVVERLNG